MPTTKSTAVSAGQAIVEILANDSKFQQGLSRAQAKLKAFASSAQSLGASVSASGAALVAPILAAAKSFSDQGDKLDKISARTGVAADALSELSFAAEQSGADVDALEGSLRKMQKTIGDALQGTKTAVDAFTALGLSVDDLVGLAPEKQFELIGARIATIEDPTIKAAAAMDVFGKSGTGIIPMLADMEALRAEAKRLGITMSVEETKAAAALNDALNRVQRGMLAVTAAIGDAVTPALVEFSNDMASHTAEVKAWISENRELITTVLKIGAAFTVAGPPIVTLGVAATGAASAIKLLAGSIAIISAHPIIALTTAAIAAGIALGTMSDNNAKVSRSMVDRASAGVRQRETDRALANELDRLAQKSSLSTEEQKRARGIIIDLEKRYGRLGISVNAATGAIDGMAKGQERLNRQMTSIALTEAKVALSELKANLSAINEKRLAISNSWTSYSLNVFRAKDEIKRLGDEAISTQTKIGILQAKVNAYSTAMDSLGEDKAIGDPTTDGKPNMTEQQINKLTDLRKDFADIDKSETAKEIERILDRKNEYQGLLDDMLDAERAKSDASLVFIELLEEEKKAVDAITDSQIKLAEERAKEAKRKQEEEKYKTINDANKSVSESIKGVNDQRDDEAFDKFLQTASSDTLTVMFQNAQAAAERYRNVMQTMAEDFTRDGVVTDDEREMLDASREEYEKSESVVNKIKDAMESVAKTFAVTGSFNSKALAQNVPMNPVEDKQLALAKEQTDLIRRLVEGIDAGGVLIVGGN